MSDAVVITHPDKLMFPDEGITKQELVDYYDLVAPVMLPHIERRPITMERFNRGVGENGFFQKNVARGFPAWLERVEVPKKGGTVNHPLVTDARSLRWLANQNCVTMHVWPSRVPRARAPRRLRVRSRSGRRQHGHAPPCRSRPPRAARRARGQELDQDDGLEGLSHCRSARGVGELARRGEVHASGRHAAGRARSRSLDAGVQQGRSCGADLRGHRPQRLQRDVRGGVYGSRAARGAGLGAVHVGRGGRRQRRRRRPSRCETCRRGSRRSAICGPTS